MYATQEHLDSIKQGSGHSLPSIASLGFYAKPVYLFLITTVTIFVSEALVMLVLDHLPPLAPYQEAFFDSTLLSILIFPILYFFVLKPLRLHINQRRQIEAEKDALIGELRKALAEVKTLKGVIRICFSCKNVRDGEGFWKRVEAYMSAHSDAKFSHGLCPECAYKLYPDLM